MLTYLSAREYIKEKHPRVVFLSLGETDEYAHEGRYEMYLQKASEADRMIGELWQWVQSTAYYRNNTTFLITTDHGRGSKSSKWQRHGEFIQGSSQVWMALIGPGIAAEGEIKKKQQHYLAQVAQTISLLVGENFPETGVAPALALTPAK
jgi:bisphosphoglycerate-independent phosphoglycerate mutase (AlkP superfamily)